MPRVSRKSLETSYFHIIVQGHNKEFIFENKEDIENYLRLLKKQNKEKEFKILSYCVMNNHAHILIYSENIEIMGRIMQKINTIYAIYYNKSRGRVGHVFRNRYQAQPIYEMNQLYNCIAYIHKNPVKAKIVEHEREYKYSTYMQYERENGVIDKNALLLTFGTKNKETFYLVHKKEIIDAIDDVDGRIVAEDCIEINDVNKLSRERKTEIAKELRTRGCTIRDIGKTLRMNISCVHKLIK